MAAKESQGLQAIIIILTILVLGLGVGLLLVNNARKTQLARATDAESRATKANADMAKAQSDSTAMKGWIGFKEGDSFDALQGFFTEDMGRFGANMPEESRNYKAVLENTYEENHKLVSNMATATDQLKDLKDRLLAVETQKEEQVKKFQSQMDKAAADLKSEKKKFADQYAAVNSKNEEIAKDLQKKQSDIDDLEKQLANQKATFDARSVKLERSITSLREGLPDVDQFAQPADGRINWVNQKDSTVWIDLGSADGLRPQVTFSVAAEGLGDAEKATKKGSIEVVRILGDHMAEAHITSDKPTNPLMVGDRIYSQVWDRGRKVGFAIAGFVDIDSDGKSDLDRLKNIIAASNGRVDAAPTESGEQEGNMNVSTRYLVLGENPNDPRRTAYRKSFAEMKDEAESLGIEMISLDEFLALMGWNSQARTVAMSGVARPEDFPPRQREQEMPRKPVQPTGAFERRVPPVSY